MNKNWTIALGLVAGLVMLGTLVGSPILGLGLSQDSGITYFAGGKQAVSQAGPADEVILAGASGVATDAAGNVFVSSFYSHRVWKVDTEGNATLVAGTGRPASDGDGGPATRAGINGPNGLALDGENLYIAEQLGNRIRRVDANGVITTVAGNGTTQPSRDGFPATALGLNLPANLVARNSEVYFTEFGGNRARKLSHDGVVTTIAGTGEPGSGGDDGPASRATLNGPVGIAFASDGGLYVGEMLGNRIRHIDAQGNIHTVAGTGEASSLGDGASPRKASLNGPAGLSVTEDGALVVAEFVGNRARLIEKNVIRTITPTSNPYGTAVNKDGAILCTLLNNGTVDSLGLDGSSRRVAGKPSSERNIGDGGPATDALVGAAAGVAVDEQGNVYIAETFNHRIRHVTPQGIIHTIAGTGRPGFSGDGGPASQAQLNSPVGVVASGDSLYLVDTNSHRIRKIDQNGVITTVAGQGIPGFAGDGGPATEALLNHPQYAAVYKGELYFADQLNHRVRKIDQRGNITTVAGNGSSESSGDGELATDAGLNRPESVVFDAAGNMYIADMGGHRVRKVGADGIIRAFAGTGRKGFAGAGGLAINADLSSPYGLVVDGRDVYIADSFNSAVWKVNAEGMISIVALSPGSVPTDNSGSQQLSAGGAKVHAGSGADRPRLNETLDTTACVATLAIRPEGEGKVLLIGLLDGGVQSIRLQ